MYRVKHAACATPLISNAVRRPALNASQPPSSAPTMLVALPTLPLSSEIPSRPRPRSLQERHRAARTAAGRRSDSRRSAPANQSMPGVSRRRSQPTESCIDARARSSSAARGGSRIRQNRQHREREQRRPCTANITVQSVSVEDPQQQAAAETSCRCDRRPPGCRWRDRRSRASSMRTARPSVTMSCVAAIRLNAKAATNSSSSCRRDAADVITARADDRRELQRQQPTRGACRGDR